MKRYLIGFVLLFACHPAWSMKGLKLNLHVRIPGAKLSELDKKNARSLGKDVKLGDREFVAYKKDNKSLIYGTVCTESEKPKIKISARKKGEFVDFDRSKIFIFHKSSKIKGERAFGAKLSEYDKKNNRRIDAKVFWTNELSSSPDYPNSDDEYDKSLDEDATIGYENEDGELVYAKYRSTNHKIADSFVIKPFSGGESKCKFPKKIYVLRKSRSEKTS